MRNLFIVLLVALTIVSCQKNEPEMATMQEVSFEAINIDPGTLKNGGEFDCPKDDQQNYLVPTVAKVVIQGIDDPFWPALFELDGKLYTQAIKLPVGTYTVTQFGLYTAVEGTLVMATPASNSAFAVYTNPDVNFTFNVTKFAKAQVPVQVLCFIPDMVTSFGFDWFQVTEIIVREQCFFGDICLNGNPFTPADFNGSLYGTNLGVDIPAIMKIVVKTNGVVTGTFNNEATKGIGAPLCVNYPDKVGVVDNFSFDLYVMSNAGYVYFTTWTFADAAVITPQGNDGVVDFVVGTCGLNDMDFPFLWPDPMVISVGAGNLATGFTDPNICYQWYFYNDQTDQINNSLGSFIAGPGVPPFGTGSAQVTVTGQERVCLANSQFGGTLLSSITTMGFYTYNPSAGNGQGINASGYLNFNVDFNGDGTGWEKRLVFVPSDNGVVAPDSWQYWDVLNGGNAQWRWSGNLWGGPWPGGNLNPANGLVTWNQIIAAYPNAKINAQYSFVGIRVGEPYPNGYTENIDGFKFGTTGDPVSVFNFDN